MSGSHERPHGPDPHLAPRTGFAIALAGLLAAGGAGIVGWEGSGYSTRECTSPLHPAEAHSPIRHLFVIIKENHAFENYFGAFPGVSGNPPNGSFPLYFNSTAIVHPFPLNTDSSPDLPHDHASEVVDEDQGRNDLFAAEANSEGYGDGADAFGYYTSAQIPQYYAYAHGYALGDEFFSGYLGPTDPNRDFDLAGTTAGQTNNDEPPVGGLAVPTILDQLTAAGVPWAYDYTGARTGITPLEFAGVANHVCESADVVSFDSFVGQLASPNPPAVTFLDPSPDGGGYSEHPPDNVTLGAEWTTAVVDAIFNSPLGTSAAILLFYDEAGGYWDPVVPPLIDGSPDGFRVPFVVISDYTPAGLVVAQEMDPGSVLRFIDSNWGLEPLNPRVAQSRSLDDYFDFAAPARAPLILPSTVNLSVSEAGTGTSGVPGDARPDPVRTEFRGTAVLGAPPAAAWVYSLSPPRSTSGPGGDSRLGARECERPVAAPSGALRSGARRARHGRAGHDYAPRERR